MQPTEVPRGDCLTLTLLATSDLHGLLSEADALSKADSWQGLARIATYVRQQRQNAANVLLMDNGDFLQGSALCDMAANLGRNGLPDHPVLKVMNHLQYDAVGLGNHEFDFGLPFLMDTLAEADFPLVCSNLRHADQSWQPRLFLRRQCVDHTGQPHELKIGVVSVMPPQTLGWNHLAHHVQATPMVQTAQRQAKQLRLDGADIVIALAHTGIGALPPLSGAEHAGAAIAALPEIDLIVCGHAHAVFPNTAQASDSETDHQGGTLAGTPAVMPNFNGSHVGQIDVELRKVDNTWQIHSAQSQAVPMRTGGPKQAPIPQDADVLTLLAPYRVTTQEHLAQPVGHLPLAVHSFFAGLPMDISSTLSALAKLHFARQTLTAETLGTLPLLSAASAFRCGGRAGPDHYTHVPAGPVSRRDLYALHPFQNTISARLLTGWQIKDWLEMAASSFQKILPNADPAPLMDPEFPGYNFDTIFGVTYEIDLTQPATFDPHGHRRRPTTASGRIHNLCFRACPIDPNQSFLVLTNSYRAGGGGNIPHLSAAPPLELPARDMRELVQALLETGLQATDLPPCPWQFKPIPNASALVQTSPLAAPYVAQVFGGQPPNKIPNKKGFLQLLLSFDHASPQPSLAFPQTQAYISQ